MSATSTVSWWEYSRKVKNSARNMRITEPTGAELAAVIVFLKAIWNPSAQTGTRPWLDDSLKKKSITGIYDGNMDNEPTHALVEMLDVVGRDLKKIPITDAEVTLVDTLLLSVDDGRPLGTAPYYGGVSGADITVP